MANGTIADAISVINNADSTGEQVRDAIVDIVELIEDPNRDAKYLVDPLHSEIKHDSDYFATVNDKSALDSKLGDTAEMINIIEYGYTSGYYKLKSNLVLDGSLPEDDRIWTTNVKNKVIAWDEITAKNFIVEVIGGTGSSSASGVTTWELLKTYDRTTDSAGKFSIRWGAHAEKIKVNVYCLVSKGSEDLDWTPNEWTVLKNNTDLLNDQVNKQCYGPVHVRIPTIAEKVISANGTYDIDNETPPAEGEYAGYKTVKVNVPTSEPTLQSKTVNANGTYTPDTGFDGFSQVTVQVPIPTPTLQSKTADSNGTYTADSGYDGLSQVTVALPLGIKNITENGIYNSEDESTPLRGFNQVRVNVQPTLESKTINANGTYTPSAGVDGFSSVVVNVSGGSVNPITISTIEDTFRHFDLTELTSKWNLFNLANVTNFYGAFKNLPNTVADLDLTGMPHGSITDVRNMFQGCNLRGDITIPAGFINADAVSCVANDMCSNMNSAYSGQYDLIIDGDNVFPSTSYSLFYNSYRRIKFQNGVPDFSNVVNSGSMFRGSYLDEIEDQIPDLDFSSVTNADNMFNSNLGTDPFTYSIELPACTNAIYLISSGNPSTITLKDCVFGSSAHNINFYSMVASSNNATEIKFDNVTIYRPTSFASMFRYSKYCTKVDLSGLTIVVTSDSIDCNRIFNGMDRLKTIVFPPSFDTSKITNLQSIWDGDYEIKNINIPDYFDTSGVTNMYYMFYNSFKYGAWIFLPTAFVATAVTSSNNKPFNYSRDSHWNPVHVFTPAASGEQNLGTINSGFIMHYGVTRAQYEAMNSIDRTPASGATPLQGANISDFTIQGMQSGATLTYDLSTDTATLIGKNSNNSRIYKLISGFESGKMYEISFEFECDQEMSGGSNGDGVEVGFTTSEPVSGSSITDGTFYKYYTGDSMKLNVPITATATDLYIYVQLRQLNNNEHTITFKSFKVIEIVDADTWTIS